MLVNCRRCESKFQVSDNEVGIGVPCPECGALNTIAPMEVIDVEYELQSEDIPDLSPVDPSTDADEDAPKVFVTEEETPWGSQRSYTVYMQRQMDNNGLPCCSLGCLIFVLLSFLLVRGCMSLF